MLGELEQLVLLGVLRSNDDSAYGAAIARLLERETGRAMGLASVHRTLARLEEKGFVTSRMGAPTPQRGGRRRRYYAVSDAGRRELSAALSALRRMARGLEIGWTA